MTQTCFQLLTLCSLSIISPILYAEIYRWVDSSGRVHFSDNPTVNYDSHLISSGKSTIKTNGDTKTSIPSLEQTAKKLRQDRLKRKKVADKQIQEKRKIRKKYEQAIAKKKKRKAACVAARKKEDLAFRKRSKSRKLTAMRKALENYEKKRKHRVKKCQ